MKLSTDKNIFTQIGLDSGSLTMLGTIVHKFPEPGEYRGILYRGSQTEATFRITVDKSIPIAQANVDLATLSVPSSVKCECGMIHQETGRHYMVNAAGYAVFHISHGPGGYAIQLVKAENEINQKPFNSIELGNEDLFSAIVIRPGTYSIDNLITKAKGELVVAYPKTGEAAYYPPNPIHVDSTRNSIEPQNIKLEPGQGQIYHFMTPSRIKIELLKADDGPSGPHRPETPGWKKSILIKGQDPEIPKRKSNLSSTSGDTHKK